MSSLSNDLEGLSLDLPDVVVSARPSPPNTSTGAVPKSNSTRRRHKKDTSVWPKKQEEDLRVPELPDLPIVVEDEPLLTLDPPEPTTNTTTTVTDSPRLEPRKSRYRRNKRGGKRKRKPVSPEISSTPPPSSSSSSGNNDKENRETGNSKVPFPCADDSDLGEDGEPKYLWRNLTKNGCIKKCILVDGKLEGGRPKPGDTVLVKSQGKLKDGTVVDDYPTLVFNVGEYEVIDGLDLAVQSMYKNELSIVSIKPEMGYGVQGRGTRAACGRVEDQVIPANSRITYLFGLLHFEKSKDMSTMTWAQRRKSGQSRMRLANWWYQRKDYPVAVKCYKKALQYYNDIPTNRECASAEEYKELLQLMEERLRVMRQVANIFKRIANLIQSGHIST